MHRLKARNEAIELPQNLFVFFDPRIVLPRLGRRRRQRKLHFPEQRGAIGRVLLEQRVKDGGPRSRQADDEKRRKPSRNSLPPKSELPAFCIDFATNRSGSSVTGCVPIALANRPI